MKMILFFSVFILTSCSDLFFERTPLNIAKKISGLEIPENVKVLTFQDEWVEFNGNGYVYIEIKLPKNIYYHIKNDGLKGGYKQINNKITFPVILGKNFNKISRGIYKISDNKLESEFEIVIFNDSHKIIYMYYSVN